jgi:hypothetical protein
MGNRAARLSLIPQDSGLGTQVSEGYETYSGAPLSTEYHGRGGRYRQSWGGSLP